MEINKLAFSGGAIKGVAYIGIFKKIEELMYERRLEEAKPDFDASKCDIPIFDIKTVCAVSVGSIFSLIYLLKYSYVEMLEEVINKKFEQLKEVRIMNFVNKYGLDSGNNLINWLKEMMIRKNINPEVTLKEFYDLNGIDFQIMATNLNKYCYKKFNYSETPEVKVLDAIRMSISIPFLFTINEYDGDIHVDGGLIDSYPIRVFDNLDNFLGFKLINHGEMDGHDVDEPINDIESYIYHILSCYMVQKEKRVTTSEEYRNCTVYIHTEDITQSVNFALTSIEKTRLIDIGYKSLSDFLKMNG
jgi:predicted acylesterase/phospholipase RssA